MITGVSESEKGGHIVDLRWPPSTKNIKKRSCHVTWPGYAYLSTWMASGVWARIVRVIHCHSAWSGPSLTRPLVFPRGSMCSELSESVNKLKTDNLCSSATIMVMYVNRLVVLCYWVTGHVIALYSALHVLWMMAITEMIMLSAVQLNLSEIFFLFWIKYTAPKVFGMYNMSLTHTCSHVYQGMSNLLGWVIFCLTLILNILFK